MADPKVIDIPGIGPTEFPAEMSDAEIVAAIKRNTPKKGFGGRLLDEITNTLSGKGIGEGMDVLDKWAYDAGGKVTDVTGSPLAGTIANTAVQQIPAMVLGGAGKGASESVGNAGRWMMNNALKPPLDAMRKGNGARAVQTLLDTGTNVSASGAQKLEKGAATLAQQVAAELRKWPWGRVDKAKVAGTVDDVIAKAGLQANPEEAIKAATAAKQEFLSHPLLQGGSQIPVDLAQELKQGTYRAVGDKAYGMGLKPMAGRDAQKALARGLKEGIEKEVPGVKALNAQEGDLLNAMELVRGRVMANAKQDPIGLGWLVNSPVSFAGFEASRSPLTKSMIARGLYSGREQIPATLARYGLGMSTLDDNSKEQQ